MRTIMTLADQGNRYIDEHKPWLMIKDESQLANVHQVCTQGINLFRSLMIFLAPVLPDVADRARAFLAEEQWHWSDASEPLLDAKINKFKPLLTRIEADKVANMVEQSKESEDIR